MKKSKIIAAVLAMTMFICSLGVSVFAVKGEVCDCEYCALEKTIVFPAGASEEIKSRITSDLSHPAQASDGEKGLRCTLFGHDIITDYIYVTTHKVRASAPRCLREYMRYEACTRCDYIKYTVISAIYVNCCV